ncbi:MAG: homocysteine S-methyltransferase family protein [Armatimonadetes bacterium]|nr:homocysteine S-methyltransferase family protein [Armatimonadota bacterium]
MLILLDGAMGTELQRRGVPTGLPLWSARALIENPDAVRRIHLDYMNAGAGVLTTNTFRTHRRSLAKAGLADRTPELTRLAVYLAKEAAAQADRPVRIAGSVSPLEDCYRPDLSPGKADDEFLEISEWLMEGGCDFLLIETMNNIAELRSAVRAAQKLGAEFWTSVNPSNDDPLSLLSGESVLEALRVCEGEGAASFLVNCAGMPVIERAVSEVGKRAKVPFGGYANNGEADETVGWRFDCELSPNEFAEHCVRLADAGATRIGGCCGTSPEHIYAAAEALDVKSA